MIPLALVTAAAMLAGWFPFSALWHQQSEIDATQAQISAVQNQDRALQLQAKSVSSATAATLLAREQYQLVSPGQWLIQVLPGNASGQLSPTSGDPGLQPLVAPSSIAEGPTTATTTTKVSSISRFRERFVRTLEFWR